MRFNVLTAHGTITIEATWSEAAVLQVEADGLGPVLGVAAVEVDHG